MLVLIDPTKSQTSFRCFAQLGLEQPLGNSKSNSQPCRYSSLTPSRLLDRCFSNVMSYSSARPSTARKSHVVPDSFHFQGLTENSSPNSEPVHPKMNKLIKTKRHIIPILSILVPGFIINYQSQLYNQRGQLLILLQYHFRDFHQSQYPIIIVK